MVGGLRMAKGIQVWVIEDFHFGVAAVGLRKEGKF